MAGGLAELAAALRRIDGRGYGAYKSIRGSWGDDDLRLSIDHVQGDPFAAPSRVSVCLPAAVHQIPATLHDRGPRRVALADFVLRRFAELAVGASGRRGSGRSGQIGVDAGGAEILARSGCGFTDEALWLRFRVGLPASGRRVLGRQAEEILTEVIPRAVRRLAWPSLDQSQARAHVDLADDHAVLQRELGERGLVAFVRDGSVLPRASGVSAHPLADAVAFATPSSLRVELPTRHHGTVTGMGIPAGVTVITGGGFHGKTTLLEALQAGVHPHIPGDGREWVVSVHDLLKLRSEDGRSVVGVDLRAFIDHLPQGKSTREFSTPDASGSTSLAAAIVEAQQAGVSAIALDEDTCATNLLTRDARMQALIDAEPITPLTTRVRQMFEAGGMSTVMVMGGSGAFLDVVDRVIEMRDFSAHDVTARAREVAAAHPRAQPTSPPSATATPQPRVADLGSFDPRRGSKKSRVRARGLRELTFGEETVDLTALEQLVDDSQARAVGVLLEWIGRHGTDGATVPELARQATAAADEIGLYALAPLPELAAVRPVDLVGAINRLRSLRLR